MALISIYFAGFLTLVIGIFHTRFYSIFGWESELSKLTIKNQKIFYTIHTFLTILIFLIGLMTIIYAKYLYKPIGLALGFNISFSIFWFVRLIWQFTYFNKTDKRKTSVIELFVIFIFSLITISYLFPVILYLFSN